MGAVLRPAREHRRGGRRRCGGGRGGVAGLASGSFAVRRGGVVVKDGPELHHDVEHVAAVRVSEAAEVLRRAAVVELGEHGRKPAVHMPVRQPCPVSAAAAVT